MVVFSDLSGTAQRRCKTAEISPDDGWRRTAPGVRGFTRGREEAELCPPGKQMLQDRKFLFWYFIIICLNLQFWGVLSKHEIRAKPTDSFQKNKFFPFWCQKKWTIVYCFLILNYLRNCGDFQTHFPPNYKTLHSKMILKSLQIKYTIIQRQQCTDGCLI